MTAYGDRLLIVMHGTVVGDILPRGASDGRLLYHGSATTPLSISMPLASARHHGRVLMNWLRNAR